MIRVKIQVTIGYLMSLAIFCFVVGFIAGAVIVSAVADNG